MPGRPNREAVATVAVVFAVVLGPIGVWASPTTRDYTNVGQLGVTITNLGYIGHAFDRNYARLPSGEWPLGSNVEHIYRGGLWVGARTADGRLRVSTGAQDANGLQEGDEIREYVDYSAVVDPSGEYRTTIWSNRQNAPNYSPRARATQQINTFFNDYANIESGSHTPMGLHVAMRTFAWSTREADDFIIIDYNIVNISTTDLRDIYLGFWIDTTVGNTEISNPYDPQATNRWNYYDDKNGAWGPRNLVPDDYAPVDDPDIWMAWEHDEDGDDGFATSWIGYRLLGTVPPIPLIEGKLPVSYNQWSFRGVPASDDWYYEGGDTTTTRLPGKYQIMSNGDFDVGETQEDNFARAGNWVSLISTGPFPVLVPGDSLRITWAIVAGQDSLALLANSRTAWTTYGGGRLYVPTGPPSPIVDVGFGDYSIELRWAPGDSVDADGNVLPPNSALRQPEHHISEATSEPDFQGYRVYRYQSAAVDAEAYSAYELIAEFDKIDGIGYDTGLPPVNSDGLREFIDSNVKEGFPYWYSVTSFSAPNPVAGLNEIESGINETNINADGNPIFPGPAPSISAAERGVGVYPNPYRAGSMLENRNIDEPELARKIWFTNLPARCTIQIFTLAGDLVRTLDHDDPSLGQVAWDVLSETDRVIASGLYIYVVRNLDTDEMQRGKLVIIK